MAGRILSISYDPMLLNTRHTLLEKEGYRVVSAEGFAEALEYSGQGPYDLVIIGHSIPHKDKQALQARIAEACPAPVLALLRWNEPPLQGAAATVDPLNIRAFLDAVQQLVRNRTATIGTGS